MTKNQLSQSFKEKTDLEFDSFYNSYKPKLIFYLTKFTKDQGISEDFADEAFVQALLKIDSYEKDKSQIHTWVYKIAENIVKKEFKDNSKLQLLSIDKENDDNLNLSGLLSNEYLDDDAFYEDELILMTKADLVKEAIHNLPSKYKDVMIMRELENKHYSDIANSFVKETRIDLNEDIIELESATDLLYLSITNNGNLPNYVDIKYKEDETEKQIEFEIKQKETFKINRDDIDNISDVVILSSQKMTGVYKTTANLSTIKSQIFNGRKIIKEMVKNKFKELDENGLI